MKTALMNFLPPFVRVAVPAVSVPTDAACRIGSIVVAFVLGIGRAWQCWAIVKSFQIPRPRESKKLSPPSPPLSLVGETIPPPLGSG